jgi:hypothetical protein
VVLRTNRNTVLTFGKPLNVHRPSRSSPPTRLSRFGKWLGGGVLLALAGWGATSAVALLVHELRPKPLPIPVQYTRIIQRAAREGWRPVQTYRADLRGTGEVTRLLILEPEPKPLKQQGSDEVRIYDVVNDRLCIRLRFTPQDLVPKGRHRLSRLADRVRLEKAVDVDGNGSLELFFAVSGRYADGSLPHPFIAVWDPARDNYRISSVLPPYAVQDIRWDSHGQHRVPLLVRLPNAGLYAENVRRLYLAHTVVVDAVTGRRFPTIATDDFVITRSRFSTVIVAAFTVKSVANASPVRLVQLRGWQVSIAQDAEPFALVHLCDDFDSRPHPVVFRWRTSEDLRTALTREWRTRGEVGYC